ncbi:hypothetical protein O3S74_014760, partial [Alcaligenes nematophilus]
RTEVLQKQEIKEYLNKPEFKQKFNIALNHEIGQILIGSQITHRLAVGYLRSIIENEIRGFQLKNKELDVLDAIGKAGKARASDFKNFPVRSMQDFSSNYLTKLHYQNLLTRKQEGRAVTYRLRGVALLSHTFGLLKTDNK